MPHMSNLSWMPLFIFFNIMFLFMLSNMKTNSTNFKSSNTSLNLTNKKWPW